MILARREYPDHLSYSQVNSIADCGERFRLERGYGLHGAPSWALIGGKAFHLATEFLDVAIESARNPGTELVYPSMDEKSVLASSTEARDMVGIGRPATETQQYVEDLQAGQCALCKLLRELAITVASTADDHPGSVRELWATALDYQINEQYLTILTGQLGESRPFALPDADRWRASGSATAAWPEKENQAWWKEMGVSMLEAYLHWRRTSGWVIAYLGVAPAIELDLSAVVGGIPVKGFMDRGMLNPILGGAPTVVDIKTNKNQPSSAEQLGMYATLFEILGLSRPSYGTFWMARKGVMSDPFDLTKYSIDYFSWKYRAAKTLRDSGNLQANPASTFCRICGVRDWCYAVDGPLAHQVPKPWLESPSLLST